MIIHGYMAGPQDHWFGWLAGQLEAQGISTGVPTLPESSAPHRGTWGLAVGEAVGRPDEQTIAVGHSLGCLSILRHLQSLDGPWRLGALVLVAGFLEPLPALPELDDYIADGCDTTRLAGRIDKLVVVRSDDDPLVPAGHTDRLATALATRAHVVPGAGHFLADDGVTRLPVVMERLELRESSQAGGQNARRCGQR